MPPEAIRMNPLLQEFIAESREQLERAAAELETFDPGPPESEAINTVFRAAHTIKGSCRLFGLDPVAVLVSAVEDLLDAAREEELTLERHHLDLLLQGFDVLEGWLDELEKRGELGEGASAAAAALAADISRAAGHEAAARVSDSRVMAECGWLGEVNEGLRERMFERYAPSEAAQPLVAVLYEPEADCFYLGEDPLYMLRLVPGLTALATAPTHPWPPLVELDVHRCQLRFFAFSTAPLSEVDTALRSASGLVALVTIEPTQLAVPSGTPAAAATANDALHLLDQGDLPGAVATAGRLKDDGHPWLASAARWVERLAAQPRGNIAAVRALLYGMATGQSPESRLPAAAAPPQRPAARTAAVQKLLRAQVTMLSESGEPALASAKLRSAADVVERCARQLARDDLAPSIAAARQHNDGAALRDVIDELLAASAPASEPPATSVSGVSPDDDSGDAPEAKPAAAAGEVAMEYVRVELRQIDRLMDLIGEMVVAKNTLPYLAQQAEAQGSRELARGLKERYANIHRVVQEMQATMAAVGRVPLAHGFRRLPRLVRDAARRVRKEVTLSLEGETVEADRRVVDALGEPLLHLVRNAIDHGLEPPAQRIAAGKPAVGRLRVVAHVEGDRLVIEIADDGRGVDIAAVKRQAYERGLIDEDALAGLGEEAALQLLFQPGFSTRDTVTEISGRGVGLDVVRNAVQSLGGSVALHSRPGVGTRVLLTLPLSMATVEVMLVESAGQRFGVPVAQIAQTLKIPRAHVRQIKRHRAFVLRGKVVPLFAARAALGMEPDERSHELSILVARLAGSLVGLEVDGFAEVAEVVMKPLGGVLAQLPQYAGSAVLADGSVLLVLDLPRLVSHADRV